METHRTKKIIIHINHLTIMLTEKTIEHDCHKQARTQKKIFGGGVIENLK